MGEPDYSQKRGYYRLIYPEGEQPILQVEGRRFVVADLCEQGVKFHVPESYRPPPGTKIEGILKFRDGSTQHVAGHIQRVDDEYNECVALLSEGVPFAKMMQEQRYIFKKYNVRP